LKVSDLARLNPGGHVSSARVAAVTNFVNLGTLTGSCAPSRSIRPRVSRAAPARAADFELGFRIDFYLKPGAQREVQAASVGESSTKGNSAGAPRTTAGDLDLQGDVTGIGAYPAVRRLSTVMKVYGRDERVLSLEGLEVAKRAAGRLKDLVDVAELREIRRLQA
jgi:hypothetical protein